MKRLKVVTCLSSLLIASSHFSSSAHAGEYQVNKPNLASVVMQKASFSEDSGIRNGQPYYDDTPSNPMDPDSQEALWTFHWAPDLVMGANDPAPGITASIKYVSSFNITSTGSNSTSGNGQVKFGPKPHPGTSSPLEMLQTQYNYSRTPNGNSGTPSGTAITQDLSSTYYQQDDGSVYVSHSVHAYAFAATGPLFAHSEAHATGTDNAPNPNQIMKRVGP